MDALGHRFGMAVLGVLVAGGLAGAEAPEKEFALAVHLVDGSCVIGTPVEMKALAVKTEIGVIRLPFDRIAHVVGAEDGQEWVIELKNRDQVEGVPELAQFELDTLIGRVAIAAEHVAEIGVGTAETVETFSRRGVMLHYGFEGEGEQVKDRSREGNHAVNHGAVVTPDGVQGGALHFDGKSAYLDLGTGSIAGLPTWENYTVSVWFLNDGGGDASRGYGQKIIDKTVMYHDFYLCVRSTGALGFQTYEGSGAGLQDDGYDYRDGQWHHAVVVKKGGYGELWIDGERKDTSDQLKTVNSTGPLLVGYSKSPDGFQKKHWSGMIDELLILKRALAPREIRKLFEAREDEDPDEPRADD